jgi:hypothetical protein
VIGQQGQQHQPERKHGQSQAGQQGWRMTVGQAPACGATSTMPSGQGVNSAADSKAL